MKNIYTVSGELLKEHIEESFEVSELCDVGTMSVAVFENSCGFGGTVGQELGQAIMQKYKFSTILPTIGVNFTIMGYVHNEEFFLFGVMIRDEGKEMSPERRCSFVEFFNTNPEGVVLRHVPVSPTILSLPGAKKALEKGTSFEDVEKYTVRAIVELCSGVSKLTGERRKGLVFKSLSSDFSFKSLSEEYMMDNDS